MFKQELRAKEFDRIICQLTERSLSECHWRFDWIGMKNTEAKVHLGSWLPGLEFAHG